MGEWKQSSIPTDRDEWLVSRPCLLVNFYHKKYFNIGLRNTNTMGKSPPWEPSSRQSIQEIQGVGGTEKFITVITTARLLGGEVGEQL
jgi:hypothetical protein